MAERGLEPSPAAVAALPPEVRAQLAELDLELSEGRSRARERAPGRRCGSRRGETWSPPRALVAVRAEGRSVPEIWPGLHVKGRSPLLPRKVAFPVVHCVLWGEGESRGWGERSSSGSGCFCAPCPPKPQTKLCPPASGFCPGAGARWGGVGVRPPAGRLTACSWTLFQGRAPSLFQLPFPPSEKETQGKSASISSSLFNNARCLPSDRSEIEAGWAVEGPKEARSSGINPERHTGRFLDHLCQKGSPPPTHPCLYSG